MKRGRHTIKEEEELFDDWFSEPNETPTPTITLPLIGKVQPEYILNKDNDDDMDEALHDQLRFLGSNERLVEEEEEEEELPELVDERTPIQEEEEEDNEDDHDSDMEDDHDEPQQGRKKNYLANPTSGPKEGWKRPSLDASTVSEDQDFILQHVETSYVVDGTEPVLRIWGCTKQGQSVLVQTRTFKPYFFVDVNNIEEMNQLVERMEAHLKQKNWKHHVVRHVLSVNPVKKRSMCGYHRNAPLRTMFKVTVAQPSYVATLRECLEKGNEAVTSRRISTFEGNLPFELRAMVDSNLSGCQWIKLKAGTFSIEHEQGGNVQYVIRPHHGLQGIHPIPISQMDDLAPMRYLSFDIETKRKKPGFCKAEEDPAVLICATLDVVGTGVVHKVVFAYVPNAHETVNPIEGATVYVFRKEKQMLLAFSQYIRESDPDAFTGWNITGFDWPYLFGRAKALDIFDEFVQFTRVAGKKAWMRSQVFKSKAYGAKKNNELLCEGRFDYDGLLFMLRGQMTKYRSYKLNAISKEVLNDQKVEVDYTQIPALHEGTDEDRTRLAFYCLKDSILPVELLNKLMAVINGIEQSRVTGVPIKWLLSRGQGVKTQSNMFRYKEACEVIPSRSPKSTGVYTAGGYVRDPLRGYYEHPLATLDFSSLYPSIMQAYNICYSTVESLAWAKANLKEGDYWIVPPLDGKGTPNDFVFVKKHIREGVLPKLLTALLAQRTYVKNLMKSVDQVTQKQYYNVLDGRQLALKVVCNSVYGFLKAFILTDSRLMAAVTAWGRTMIVNTAALVEDKYKDNMIVDRAACEALGLDYEQEPAPGVLIDPRPRKKYPARIIYGDTDSVIVDFGDCGLQDIARYGREAAAMCTTHMEPPNSLAFESVKLRSLFMNKKRYASLEILAVVKGETTAQAISRGKVNYKGLESKRRDNAPIGSNTQAECLKKVLKFGDVEGAADFVRKTISDLLMDRVDMSNLVISKGLSKTNEEYEKGGSKQIHVELAKRISKRSKYTGEIPPDTGDRVAYIMKAGTTRKSGKGASKAFELAEDPIYAMESGAPINIDYYITKQLMAATLRVFTCIWEPNRCKEVKSTMSKKVLRTLLAYQRLFAPNLPHMMQKKERKSGSYGIGAFAKPLPKCLKPGCRKRSRDVGGVVCEEHPRESALEDLKLEMERRVKLNDEKWDRCRKCAGGGFSVVTCSNVICDNFFARRKTQLDIEELEKDLAKFGDIEDLFCSTEKKSKI